MNIQGLVLQLFQMKDYQLRGAVILQKLIFVHVVKKFHSFCETQTFIAVFIRVGHRFLSRARRTVPPCSLKIPFNTNPPISAYVLKVLSFRFATKILYDFLTSHVCYMSCPSHAP
jgi:hypothetical protein